VADANANVSQLGGSKICQPWRAGLHDRLSCARPFGGEAKFNEGTISSLSVGGDAGYMQISVPVHPGNSGGALLNRSGDVVGVVIATASALTFLKGTGSLPQNVSWAVKGAFAGPLFDQPAPSPRITDRSAIVRRAARATCSVTASAEPT
jgi:Trypsin-like peptidase domain